MRIVLQGSFDDRPTWSTSSARAEYRAGSAMTFHNNMLQHPLLSQAETYALIELYKAGNARAGAKLVACNLKFVYKVTTKFLRPDHEDFWDAFNCGSEGLMHAAAQFDLTRNFRFITYAVWWVRQRISFYIGRHSQLIRMTVSDIKNTEAELLNTLPADDALRKRIIAKKSSNFKHQANIALIPLDARDQNGNTISDLVPDIEINHDDNLTIEKVMNVVQTNMLAQRDSFILTKYFGLDSDGVGMSLRDIGDVLGVSHERVRQLKVRALRDIRLALQRSNIRRSDIGELECNT